MSRKKVNETFYSLELFAIYIYIGYMQELSLKCRYCTPVADFLLQYIYEYSDVVCGQSIKL